MLSERNPSIAPETHFQRPKPNLSGRNPSLRFIDFPTILSLGHNTRITQTIHGTHLVLDLQRRVYSDNLVTVQQFLSLRCEQCRQRKTPTWEETLSSEAMQSRRTC